MDPLRGGRRGPGVAPRRAGDGGRSGTGGAARPAAAGAPRLRRRLPGSTPSGGQRSPAAARERSGTAAPRDGGARTDSGGSGSSGGSTTGRDSGQSTPDRAGASRPRAGVSAAISRSSAPRCRADRRPEATGRRRRDHRPRRLRLLSVGLRRPRSRRVLRRLLRSAGSYGYGVTAATAATVTAPMAAAPIHVKTMTTAR